jgi:hypothetical protein
MSTDMFSGIEGVGLPLSERGDGMIGHCGFSSTSLGIGREGRDVRLLEFIDTWASVSLARRELGVCAASDNAMLDGEAY